MFGVRIFAGLLVISICFGCGKGSKKNDEGEPLSAKIIEGQTGKNLYARGFSILPTNRGWELTLMDPWNIGEVFAKYDISADSPAFNRWAVSSTTHIGFLDALGATDKIVGCTSPDRVYNKDLVARYEAGDLHRIGSDMELNLESVLGLEPDIILQTAF